MKTQGVFCSALIAALLCGCEPGATELRLVKPMGNTRNVSVAIAEDFADLLGNQSSVSVTLTENGMSDSAALDALMAGDADIALVPNSMPFRVGVSTVLPMYSIVLHITYRDGMDATDGRSLMHGARVFAGAPGSASRLMFESVKSRLDLTDSDFTYADPPRPETIESALPDVFVVFMPIAPSETLNHPQIPADVRSRLRLAGMGSPGDIGTGSSVDSATLLNPHLEPFIIPVGTYGDIPEEPILTVSVDMLMVARTDLDAAVVYDLVQEVLRLKPALAAQRPGVFQRLSDQYDSSNSTFVLHPGLIAYEQRDAPSAFERYSGIAEVAATLLVGIVSAGFAATHMYRSKRKNRIDVFYAKVMEIRKSVGESSDTGQSAAATAELKELQTTAFEQLIDEKLAADESFRIFLTLSNEVMQELASDVAQQR